MPILTKELSVIQERQAFKYFTALLQLSRHFAKKRKKKKEEEKL